MADRELTEEEARALGLAPPAERELSEDEARALGIAAPPGMYDDAPPALPAPDPRAQPTATGGTARDVALGQLGEGRDEPTMQHDRATTRGEAVGLGLLQGASSGQASRMADDIWMFDPEVRRARPTHVEPGAAGRAMRARLQKAEKDQPGAFLLAEVGGATLAPDLASKAGVPAKAAAAAAEGAVYAHGTGGSPLVGAGAGAVASLAGSAGGKVARKVIDKLGDRATARTTAAAGARASREAADAAAVAARAAEVATKGPAASPAAAGAVEVGQKVWIKDGTKYLRNAVVESVEPEGVRVSGTDRLIAPSRVEPVADVGAKFKPTKEAVRAALDAKRAARETERAAVKAAKEADRLAGKGRGAGFTAKVIGGAAAGGAGLAALPAVVEDPEKAAGKFTQAVGLGVAAAGILKGKKVAGRVAEKLAARAKTSGAAKAAAGAAGRAATGARRVAVDEAAEAR